MPDINFQCPNCSGTLDVPRERANQLVECPVCKKTIEVPAHTQKQTSDFGFATSASADESVFFQSGDVLVTNARFVIGAKTFAMRGITSVEVVESKEAVKLRANSGDFVLIGIGLVIIAIGVIFKMYGFGFGVLIITGIIGLLMLIIGAFPARVMRIFKVVLKTAGGDVIAYQSFDGNHISQIVRALNDSIVSQR
jgi:hypothetical protein